MKNVVSINTIDGRLPQVGDVVMSKHAETNGYYGKVITVVDDTHVEVEWLASLAAPGGGGNGNRVWFVEGKLGAVGSETWNFPLPDAQVDDMVIDTAAGRIGVVYTIAPDVRVRTVGEYVLPGGAAGSRIESGRNYVDTAEDDTSVAIKSDNQVLIAAEREVYITSYGPPVQVNGVDFHPGGRVSNVSAPEEDGDAANKEYVDAAIEEAAGGGDIDTSGFVLKEGNNQTIKGVIQLEGNNNERYIRIPYDGRDAMGMHSPRGSLEISDYGPRIRSTDNAGQIELTVADLTDGRKGKLRLNASEVVFNNSALLGVGDPIVADSAANKRYVDGRVVFLSETMSYEDYDALPMGAIILNATNDRLTVQIGTTSTKYIYPGEIYQKRVTNDTLVLSKIGGLGISDQLAQYSYSLGTSAVTIPANGVSSFTLTNAPSPVTVVSMYTQEGSNYPTTSNPCPAGLNMALTDYLGNRSLVIRNLTSSAYTFPAYTNVFIRYYAQ